MSLPKYSHKKSILNISVDKDGRGQRGSPNHFEFEIKSEVTLNQKLAIDTFILTGIKTRDESF